MIPPLVMLGASLAVLALAPAIHLLLRRQRALESGLDGFVVVTIGAMALLHIIPAAIAAAGWWAALVALAGALGTDVVERALHGRGGVGPRSVHAVALVLAVGGLVLHTVVDGMGLAVTGGPQGAAAVLPLGVVIHRLPAGLMVWIFVREAAGPRTALLTLGLMCGGTVAGFLLGERVAALGSSSAAGLVQALVAGTLLHVVLHRHGHGHVHGHAAGRGHHTDRHGGWQLGPGTGALIGVLFMLLLTHVLPGGHAASHQHHGPGALFWSLAARSAPALLLGYLVAGLLAVWLPRGSLAWLGRGGALRCSLKGVAHGLPLSVCSCCVATQYRGLVRAGVPAAAAMSFLVAAPGLGVDALALSVPLLGVELTLARIAGAGVAALLVGWIVGGRVPPPSSAGEGPAIEPLPGPRGVAGRLGSALRAGLGEMFVATATWIIVGLLLAAVAGPLLQGSWLTRLSPSWQVPLLALAGLPVYICAAGATPLAAVLIHHGVSPGAALALLVTGPATHLTSLGMLSRQHGSAHTARFAVAAAVLAVGLGLAVDALLAGVSVPWRAPAPTGATSPGWLHRGALAALGLVLLVSLLRHGPRGLMASLFPPQPGHGAGDEGPCAAPGCSWAGARPPAGGAGATTTTTTTSSS